MTISEINTLIAARTDGGDNTVDKERQLWNVMKNQCCMLYEVKELDVNLAISPNFITDNFDDTGLGINDYLGFAICNGSNGTKNRGGKTSVGYKASSAYQVIGGLGGNEKVLLTKNNIPVMDSVLPVSNADNGGGDHSYVMATNTEPAGTKTYTGTVNGNVGTIVAHDNMQPYIITLMIQRIA